MKLDLLTNATVVDDAIRFVSEYIDQKQQIYKDSTIVEEKEETIDVDQITRNQVSEDCMSQFNANCYIL
jgi:hypothetical protein